MKNLLCLSLVLTSLLCADPWKGDDYAKNNDSQKSSAEDFMQGVQFKGTECILDVGCGDGKITAAMARSVPKGDVVGVDISSSMIQAAKGAFSEQQNLRFLVEDAAKVDFDQKFDLITSFTVMQWVLEQTQALQRFEKALKPGGKLWIQMPTGLPVAMQQALDKTLSSEKWKGTFAQFSPPWRFYQADEYKALLQSTHFKPVRLDVVSKHEHFPSRAAFHGFLKQWFPYLRPLAADQKDAFLTDLLDNYLSILPVDDQGRVSFIVDRLEVEASNDENACPYQCIWLSDFEARQPGSPFFKAKYRLSRWDVELSRGACRRRRAGDSGDDKRSAGRNRDRDFSLRSQSCPCDASANEPS